MEVHFVAAEPGPKRSADGSLTLVADRPLDAVPAPDILLVPGGVGELAVRDDARVTSWLRGAHAESRFTTSVCTGSLVLAAAGMLEGVRATTHWLAMEELGRLGAIPV